MTSFFSTETIDWFWRVFLTQSIILFLFFVSFSNIPVGVSEFRVQFFLMAVFYWTIFRPSLLPYIFIFLCGIAQDILMHYPIGFHAIFFLLFQFIIKRQRIFLMGQSHFALWMIFSLSCILYFLVEWLFFSLIFLSVENAEISVISGIITILLYPIITFIFIPFHKLLPVVKGVGK